MSKSRVVVVAQSYPPVGGSHATRVAAVVSRLCRETETVGIAPEVGTRYPNRSPIIDELPVEVVRTFPGVAHALAHGRSSVHMSKGSASNRPVTNRGRSVAGIAVSQVASLFRRIQIVDAYFDWIPHLALTMRRVVRPGDVVLSMSMPHSVHVGTLIGLRGRVNRWVVDMADPWTLDRSRPRPAWKLRIERWLEGRVFARASAVYFVTERTLAEYRERFPESAEKMKLSRMGYEASDASGPVRELEVRPTLFYGGSLQPENRDASELLSILGELGGIRFIFAGGAAKVVHEYFAGEVPSHVQLINWLGHEEYCGYVRAADGCIVFGNKNPQQVPGKVYQVAGLARRVLYFPQMSPADDEALRCLGADVHLMVPMSAEELAKQIPKALESPERSTRGESFTWDRTLLPLLADVLGVTTP